MLTLQGHADRHADRCDFVSLQTVTASSGYVAGDVLGAVIEINDLTTQTGPNKEAHLSSILQDVVVYDQSHQDPAMDLWFFNQAPATTFTNKTQFSPSPADLKKCIGVVHVAVADYSQGGTNGDVANSANQRNLGIVLKPGNNQTGIWCVAVARGAVTFTQTSLQFRFKFAQGL